MAEPIPVQTPEPGTPADAGTQNAVSILWVDLADGGDGDGDAPDSGGADGGPGASAPPACPAWEELAQAAAHVLRVAEACLPTARAALEEALRALAEIPEQLLVIALQVRALEADARVKVT